MKHLNRFFSLVAGSLLTCTTAAQAQRVWQSVTMPRINYYENEFVLPAAQPPGTGLLWALRNQFYGLGRGGSEVYRSLNSGTTWQTGAGMNFQFTGMVTGERYLDVCALDASNAWIVSMVYSSPSNTYRLLHTTSGVSGFMPANGPADPRQVRFIDANRGVVVTGTAGATFYRTTDGGITWSLASTAPTLAAGETVQNVSMLSNKLWITTSLGRMLTADDAGLTWGVGTVGLGNNLLNVTFRTHDNGLAMNITGQLAATTDGGLTWLPISTTGPLRTRTIAAVPGTAGTYLSGGGSFPYGPISSTGSAISTDEGRTWQNLENTFNHRCFVPIGPGEVLAMGRNELGVVNVFARYQGPALATAGAKGNDAVAFYPNPTSGQVHLAAAAATRQLAVYDAVGRMQKQFTVPAGATEADLTGLPAGSYQVMEVGVVGKSAQRITICP